MRRAAGLLLAVLVLLAGCSFGFQGLNESSPTGANGPGDGGTGPGADGAPPDPSADRIGWEDGYWHNESIGVNASDGLNDTERQAVVARAMARVEAVRGLEFNKSVPVEVVSRQAYRQRFLQRGNHSQEFRLFDNAKFEGLFLVGEDRDSLAAQNQNRGENVLGFYTPRNETIILVSGSGTPIVRDELTLGHELVHALQDQHYNLSNYRGSTRDEHNGFNGLVEGDANFVQRQYSERCQSGEWECISVEGQNPQPGDFHVGLYVFSYFPYSDGPPFVQSHYTRDGWAGVNALYDRPPASAEQVIHPDRYPDDTPSTVPLEDTNRGGWERLSPDPPSPNESRADYATLGEAAMTTMFAYTLYDEYNDSQVIEPQSFLNVDGNELNRTDPFEYGIQATAGWEGDRMHVYRNPEYENETAYVWKTVWESPTDAREFADAYRATLAHWGGTRVSGTVWRVRESPYADAFAVQVEGNTVVIVNAPTQEELREVSAEAR